jgi:hypothetical protein
MHLNTPVCSAHFSLKTLYAVCKTKREKMFPLGLMGTTGNDTFIFCRFCRFIDL